jgi:hypothetical protein
LKSDTARPSRPDLIPPDHGKVCNRALYLAFGPGANAESIKGSALSATRTPWITDPPLVVEIIDSEERITAFLPLLDGMVTGGLVSLEEIRILRYGPDKKEA